MTDGRPFKAKKVKQKRSRVSQPGEPPARPKARPLPNLNKSAPSIPTGKPSPPLDRPSSETGVEPTKNEPSGDQDQVVFSVYTPGKDGGFAGFTVSDNVPDVTGAESEGVVIRALNTYIDISIDHGKNFKRYDPATIFAKATPLGGGIWCDQIVLYVRAIDRFVWFIQYRPSAAGEGSFRVAVASPAGIQNDPTAWTYWDWVAGDFGDATQDLDFPDLASTSEHLLVGTDLWDKPATAGAKPPPAGRLIMRLPVKQIAKGAQLGGDYVKITDTTSLGRTSLKAHFAQNSSDAALWAGHVDNSTVRVYRWADSSNSTDAAHDVKVASWPKTLTKLTSKGPAPSGTDWLSNLNGSIRFQVLGAARDRNDLWLGWTAASGDGGNGGFSFPNPHVRLVQVDLSNWNAKSEFQIWNNDYAFAYPALNVNARGELGMGVAFGGSKNNPDSAFGILGDYVVWYVNGSDTTLMRWGDFITVRAGQQHRALFCGFGYFTMKSSQRPVGYLFNPFYVQFGRKSVSP